MSSTKRPSDGDLLIYGTKQVFKKPRTLFLPDILDGEVLKITVGTGDEAKQYKIDRGVLSHASQFFRAASTNGFAETASGHIELPEDKPAAFDMFLHWTYTSKVLPILHDDVTKPELYLHAMVTADKLLVPDLVQRCWTEIRNWFALTEFPTPNFINELYALSSSIYFISKAQKYFVAMVRVFIESNMHLDKWEALLACNESFAADIARLIIFKRTRQIRSENGTDEFEHCAFDFHPFGMESYLCAGENIAPDSRERKIHHCTEVLLDRYSRLSCSELNDPFSNWTLIKPSKEDMSAAGFYWLDEKHAFCTTCKIKKHAWKEGEDPFLVHSSWDCQFMYLVKAGIRVPLLKEYECLPVNF